MPQRTRADTIKRRARVAELMEWGERSSVKIAERLGQEGITITDRAVRDDMKIVADEWRSRYLADMKIIKLRKVAEADKRSDELRAEWHRSKLDKQRTRTKAKQKAGGEGQDDGIETETEEASEGRLAEVACMTEIRRNDEYIADLLGLKEPTRHAHGGDPGAPPIKTENITVELNNDTRLARIAELAAAKRSAQHPAPGDDGRTASDGRVSAEPGPEDLGAAEGSAG